MAQAFLVRLLPPRVDLRKVLGGENPADLLTKHSLSRQRLEKLVALHGCKFLAGRAASVPRVREGETTRITKASAGGGLIRATGDGPPSAAQPARRSAVGIGAVDYSGTLLGSGTPDEEPATNLGRDPPTMLHLELRGRALENAYPPIVVPEDEDLPDLVRDKDDVTFQVGLEEPAVIAMEARDHGRKRKMSPNKMTPPGGRAAKETVNLAGLENLVKEQDLATTRSSVGRRRSEKEGLVPSQLKPKGRYLKDPKMHMRCSFAES